MPELTLDYLYHTKYSVVDMISMILEGFGFKIDSMQSIDTYQNLRISCTDNVKARKTLMYCEDTKSFRTLGHRYLKSSQFNQSDDSLRCTPPTLE